MRPNNPFIVAGYRGPDYFCDREKVTKDIISALTNERNVTLMAPRRYGKTGLIRNVFQSLDDSYAKIYIDIYATSDLRDFTQTFAKAVIGALDSNVEKAVGTVGRFFSRFRPTATPDAAGNVSLSFSLEDADMDQSIKDVFDYLASKDRRIVIAIDEFQQILKYPETGTEALLRSYVQFSENVQFIFAGSQHHLMAEMFTSPRHPFYQSTDILSLDVIPCDRYCAFAESFFKADGRAFSQTAFQELYRRFDGITWYIQSVLNRIWGEGEGLRDTAQIDSAVSSLVEVRALTFHDLYVGQTDSGRLLLKALAMEGLVPEITSGAFIARHGLVASSSVRTALSTLMANDLVYRTEKGYIVYDRLFALWLRKMVG